MSKPDVIFFDVGSTLLTGMNAKPAKYIVHMLGMDMALIPEVENFLYTTCCYTAESLFSEFYSKFKEHFTGKTKVKSYHEGQRILQYLWDTNITTAKPIDGAITSFKWATELTNVSIVSNAWQPLRTAFDVFFSRDEDYDFNVDYWSFAQKETKPTLLSKVVDNLKGNLIDPATCVMVGDNYDNDIKPALDLGMKAVWVLHRESVNQSKHDISNSNLTTINNISELSKWPFLNKFGYYPQNKGN